MSRDDIFFLDPHTWISQLPDEIVAFLEQHGIDVVSEVLSRLGAEAWLKALTDEDVLPPKALRKRAWEESLSSAIQDSDILAFAVYYTRFRICIYLREETGVFHTRISSSRNPRKALDEAGLQASKLILGKWPDWVIPYTEKNRFAWDMWLELPEEEEEESCSVFWGIGSDTVHTPLH